MNIEWRGTPNYSGGNLGRLYIFPHICEGWYEGSITTLQNPSRQASAHYVVSGDDVAQLVSEDDTAWHCGNSWYNKRSLSIELCGTTADPPSRGTLATAAALMADMSRRWLGGKRLVLGKDGNVMLHKWVYDTSCPSTTDIGYLLEKANANLGYEDESEEDMQLGDMIVDDGYIMDGSTYANVGNCIYWAERNTEKLLAEVSALSAAVKALAEAKGADPDEVAAKVGEAVKAKLEGISLSVTAG